MADRFSEAAAPFASFLAAAGGSLDPGAIAARLRAGPVPPGMLVDLARAAGFPGLAFIEEAAAGPRAASPATRPAAIDDPPALDETFDTLFGILGEHRSGQLEMARAIDGVLQHGGLLFVEAGTGTGKSLAYLVPAFLHHLASGNRVVVSTHTRNLQEQLLSREVRIACDAIGTQAPVARLMGRERYLCARHVVSAVVRLLDRPRDALAVALAAALAPEGIVDGLAGLPRGVTPASLAAPRRCSPGGCAHAAGCPLTAARRRAREAAIVLVNHALLLSDYRQGGGLFGPWDRVVFDEAHHLEECVTDTLSVTAASGDLDRLLEPLLPLSRRRDGWRLLLHELSASGAGTDRERRLESAAEAAASAREAYRRLFELLGEATDRGDRRRRQRYRDGVDLFAPARGVLEDIFNHIKILSDSLRVMLEPTARGDAAGFQGEIAVAVAELDELAEGLRYLAGPGSEEDVYWIERDAGGRLSAFRGSPVAVDRIFADFLDEAVAAAVFTSATIAQGERFDGTMETLGVPFSSHEARSLVATPPFDPAERCLLLLGGGGGDPNAPERAGDIAGLCEALARRLGRRSMVLFTSYRMCLSTARLLTGRGMPGPVLVQEPGKSREVLARRLRAEPGATLLGVASFWEGVDFPGEELEVLVIPKLPFPVPDEPIVEARAERLRRFGEDPFEHLFLPAAIRRLRQGMGRLIRRRTDRGVVVIMDERIDRRPYGKTILDALPVPARRAQGIGAVVDQAADWFERG